MKKVVVEMLRKGTPTEFIAEVTRLGRYGIGKMRGNVVVKVGFTLK